MASPSIAELDWIPWNVTSFPVLLLAIQIEATIWSPLEDEWCHITNVSIIARVHLQVSLEALPYFHPDIRMMAILTMKFHDAITAVTSTLTL